LIARTAAVESNSEHPLAKAIVTEAKRRNVTQLSATNFEALAGRGAKAFVQGETIVVGGPRLLTEAKVAAPPEVGKLTTAWATDGKTVLYVVAQDRLLGAFAVEDEIRPESVKPSPNFIGLVSSRYDYRRFENSCRFRRSPHRDR